MAQLARRAGLKPVSMKSVGLLAAIAVGAGALTAAAALPVIGAVGVAVGSAAKSFVDLPVQGLGQVPSRSVLLDTAGQPLAYYYPGPVINGQPNPIYRVPVPYAAIAPVMRNAVVAIEDYRFWQHGALDLRGLIRAVTTTLSGAGTQGGSDLAQQYVKNACELAATSLAQYNACNAETVARKIRELRIAADVERTMTKPQLLAAYLNVAYFDHQTHGIYVAAQYYFSEKPSQLTLPQAALLAGIVQDPTTYDPVANPAAALARRNVVLQAMATHGYISHAAALRAGRAPLGLHPSPIPLGGGCISPVQADAAYFCDYVLAVMKHDPQYAKAYNELTTVGGLKIYTTMSPRDQRAATRAVKFVLPPNNGYYNPNKDVDTQVMVQPGTGYLRAIAVNQPYGFGPGQTSIDYAAPTPYDGGVGVQTGSSSKIFTLITALKQGLPFGFSLKEKDGGFYGPYYGCHGQYVAPVQFHNAEGAGENGTIPLYYGTTASINGFYAALEAKVGLCNVVKTAMSMGLTWADGTSLLHRDNGQPSADEIASFTLGAVYVSPMSMAAAYASVDSRGIYCHPIAILRIVDVNGRSLPVESAGCHRVMPQSVADAANYVLQGVLTGGTAAGRGIGRPAAAKTGTANGGYYAAFAGYTPTLVAYTSVFNPTNPTGLGAMVNCPNSDYREFPGGGLNCPGQMFGDNAPGATWEYAFTYAALGPPLAFAPPASLYFSMGPGTTPKLPPKKKHKPGPGGGGGGGGGGGNGGGGNGNGHGHHCVVVCLP